MHAERYHVPDATLAACEAARTTSPAETPGNRPTTRSEQVRLSKPHAVDVGAKAQLRRVLRQQLATTPAVRLIVTHDPVDAMALADRGDEVHVISYALPSRLTFLNSRIFFHEVDVGRYPLFEYPPYDLALAVMGIDDQQGSAERCRQHRRGDQANELAPNRHVDYFG